MAGKLAKTQFDRDVLEGEILSGAEEKIDANEKRVAKGFWKTLARASGKIPFAQDLIAAYYCALDPETPNRTRAILLAALAYFVLPTDAIPDFLAVFGFSDDVAVLGAVIASLGGSIKDSHRAMAKDKLDQLAAIAEDETDHDSAESG